MRRLVSALVVVVAVGAGAVLSGASEGDTTGKSYEIEFDSAFGLVEGGDLKIGGVKAGVTKDFQLTEREPYRVVATVEVNQPGFDSLRADASCDVRQQSLIGEYFIDCDLGRSQKELPEGGRVPASRTSSTIPPDLINTVMRRPYRERFRLILSELGVGLAGRPRDLNEVIRRAHPALRETTETLAILRRQNRIISDFFRDADEVSRNVEPRKEDVARWIEEAADAAGIQATRAEEFRRYYNRLPTFLRELEPTMLELGRTADRQIPTLRKLAGAAPELERFLRSVQPFARSSRESIDDLGEAAKAGRGAIRQSRAEIRELRALSRFAPRLGKPLRQFLQTLDDRRRSMERDPIAKETAPPPPDKTAYDDSYKGYGRAGQDGQGFTGMEALWNYFYYQTQAINAFDEFGHLLRLVIFTDRACSPYASRPTKEVRDRCNSYLGEYQPGVDPEDKDPTEGQTSPAAQRTDGRGSTRAERERPPGAGAPEAPPIPGQRDLSKPQITLPNDVRELLDRLGQPVPNLPQGPLSRGGDERAVNELLDYLLGP